MTQLAFSTASIASAPNGLAIRRWGGGCIVLFQSAAIGDKTGPASLRAIVREAFCVTSRPLRGCFIRPSASGDMITSLTDALDRAERALSRLNKLPPYQRTARGRIFASTVPRCACRTRFIFAGASLMAEVISSRRRSYQVGCRPADEENLLAAARMVDANSREALSGPGHPRPNRADCCLLQCSSPTNCSKARRRGAMIDPARAPRRALSTRIESSQQPSRNLPTPESGDGTAGTTSAEFQEQSLARIDFADRRTKGQVRPQP